MSSIPPGAFGSSEVYPSHAAGYGAEQLMAMAGTLAEKSESRLRDLGDLAPLDSAVRVAQVYATLAQAAAIREQTEKLEEHAQALRGTIELLPGAMPG